MNDHKIFKKLRCLFQRILNKTEMLEETVSDADAALVMENQSRINRDLYFEAARALHRRWTRFIEIAFGALLLVSGIAGNYIFLTVTGAMIIVLCVLSWRSLVRRDFSILREIHGCEEWKKTVRFYSTRIETENGAGHISAFRYQNIKRYRETKHMFIIDFGKKAPATMMCKDGFTVGTLELAKSFIIDMKV